MLLPSSFITSQPHRCHLKENGTSRKKFSHLFQLLCMGSSSLVLGSEGSAKPFVRIPFTDYFMTVKDQNITETVMPTNSIDHANRNKTINLKLLYQYSYPCNKILLLRLFKGIICFSSCDKLQKDNTETVYI